MADGLHVLEAEWCKTYPPVELSHPKLAQQRTIFLKSFNMLKEYASHINSGIREHMQNWYDQCKVLCPAGATLNVLEPPAAPPNLSFLAVTGGQKTLGFVAQYSDNSVASRVVVFKNYGTQLSTDQMSLGMTTKREDNTLAGVQSPHLETPVLSHRPVKASRLCKLWAICPGDCRCRGFSSLLVT